MIANQAAARLSRALLCATVLLCGSTSEAKSLFGINFGSGGLYDIDTTTGAGSLAFSAPSSNSLTPTPTGLLLELSGGSQFETINTSTDTVTPTGIFVTNLGNFTNVS